MTGERPLEPGQSGTTYLPNGMPALQPARGLKADLLFAEKLTDENARFARLENAVVEMREEFDAVKPAIVRLAAVESDMQFLLTQLEALVQKEPPPPDPTLMQEDAGMPVASVQEEAPEAAESVPAIAPVSIIPAESGTPEQASDAPVEAPQPSSTPVSSGVTVKNIRIGEHGDMTRLVIDISGPASYHVDIDNAENFMLIELPDAGWSAPRQGSFADAPLLTSWAAQPMENNKGSHVILQLRNDVVVVKQDILSGPDRIVIDLKKM